MRLRKLGVSVAAVTAAALALSACSTKIGTAAVVGGHRISDNSVNRYVQQGAVPFQSTDSSGATSTVVPKVSALQELVTVDLFQAGLKANGGPATATELTSTQAQILNGETVAAVEASVEKQGFTARFAQLAVQYDVLLTVLETRLKDDGSGSATVVALTKLHIPVQVSARYGVWSASTFSISSGTSDGVPSFVKLTGSAGAAGAAATSPSTASG